MANEWTLVTQLEPAIPYTVANGTGIEKGTVLKITDSGTAIISTASTDPTCGIAYVEKIASDGNTQLAVLKRGRAIVTASGAITVGWPVKSAAGSDTAFSNTVMVCLDTAANSGAVIIGTAEATFADGERGQIFFNFGSGTK